MGMPKGLRKATNYYNNLESWRDWNNLASQVSMAGFPELVAKHIPPSRSNWRLVDKSIAALRKDFQDRQNARLIAEWLLPDQL